MRRKSIRRCWKVTGDRASMAAERLEARFMLSLAAVGAEFRVNTTTFDSQTDAAIASDGDGDFVVVWTSDIQDGNLNGIYAQRYNSSGVAQGSEFRVNTYTIGNQLTPAVAMDADGDFVVVWSSTGQDGYLGGVFGQRFNANGVPQGSEFRVNTFTFGSESRPSVAMDAAGDFVIAWSSTYQEGFPNLGIYAQRYDFNGVRAGSEFHVNTYTTGTQDHPVVAMDATGDFVIAWQSQNQESAASGYGIYAQRFNAAGQAVGSEFRVNSYTTGDQTEPAVAMDYSGSFVVAWQRADGGGAAFGLGIFSQRFNSSGVAQGSEFRVNTYTTSDQASPRVGIDADGDFLIAWQSAQDGSGQGVYAKAYTAAGAESAGEFRVNSYTTDHQAQPAVARDMGGNAIVVWASRGQDGSSTGVYAQRYQESPAVAGPVVGSVLVNGSNVGPYRALRGPMNQIVVSFSENLSTVGGTSGANSITNPANWLIIRDNTNLTPLSVSYGFNAATNRYEATVTLPDSYIRGNFQIRIRESVQDTAGSNLDGDANGSPGGSFTHGFSVTPDLTSGTAAVLDSTSTTAIRSMGTVLMDDAGNVTVSWIDTTFSPPLGGSSSGKARRMNIDETLGASSFNFTPSRAAAMDSNGNYVIAAITTTGFPPSSYSVNFERFNSSNVSQGTGVAHQVMTAFQTVAVDMDSAGNFVIAWSEGNEITARRFNSAGVAQGGEFHVNTSTTNGQSVPTVVMDEEGDFVIAWVSYHTGSAGLYAQRYNSTGIAQGGEFRIDDALHPILSSWSLAADSDGDFIAAWTSASDSEIYARRFDRFGSPLESGSFLVNAYTTGNQGGVQVAMDDAGDALIAWASVNHSGAGYGIYARTYARDGVASPEFTVVEGAAVTGAVFALNDLGDLAVFGFTGQVFLTRVTSALRLVPLTTTPSVGALVDASDPVTRGDPLTLTASGITGPYLISSVSFYRESNGVAGLQTGPEGDALVGTDTTGGDGWTAAAATLPLSPGGYTYYAQATDASGLVGVPATTTNTVIAGSRPVVVNSVFHFETLPNKVMFTFDRNVQASVSVNDLEVDRLQSVNDPAFTMLPYGTDGTNVVSFVFTNPLAEANYRATLGPNIFDPGTGQPMAGQVTLDFFVLKGDANRDRRVNLYDLVAIATNWKGAGKTYSQGDFDGDGDVDASDLAILAQNWQQGLVAPAAPLPAAATSVGVRAPVRSPLRIDSNSNSLLR